MIADRAESREKDRALGMRLGARSVKASEWFLHPKQFTQSKTPASSQMSLCCFEVRIAQTAGLAAATRSGLLLFVALASPSL